LRLSAVSGLIDYQYFTKEETTPKKSPKTGVRAPPAPLSSGFFKLFRDLLIILFLDYRCQQNLENR
jgi:hypothetical protein